MKVYLGADHGGYDLKERLKQQLSTDGFEVKDCGAFQPDPEDDYPDFSFAVAEKVAQDPDAKGIVVCRSGGGVIIAANKVKGVRAVAVHDIASAEHARKDNDANVIGLAADWLAPEDVPAIVTAFLKTPYTQVERHSRRIQKIAQYEQGHMQ